MASKTKIAPKANGGPGMIFCVDMFTLIIILSTIQ